MSERAARAFETLLSLPMGHLSPNPDVPLSILADHANAAKRRLGRDAWLHFLAPYDDYCVFACVTNELWNALIAAFVLEPQSLDDYQTRGEGALTLSPSTKIYEVDAFAQDAHYFLQSMGIQTVEELVARKGDDLRRMCPTPGVVSHIEGVLIRAGLGLKLL